jgi:hypothetical protein
MPIKEPLHRNSGGRLLASLSSVGNNRSLLEEVPKLFGLKVESVYEKQVAVLAFVGDLQRLYLEFQADLLDANITETQRTAFLTGLESLQELMYPVGFSSGIRPLSDAEASLLRVCATFLEEEVELEQEDVDEVRSAIDQLRQVVEGEDVDPQLKRVLLELVRLANDSVARFEIHGGKGLQRAFKSMLGEAAELYLHADSEGKREELTQSNGWQAGMNCIRVFDRVASKLMDYQPLLEGASQIFLNG